MEIPLLVDSKGKVLYIILYIISYDTCFLKRDLKGLNLDIEVPKE